MHCLPPHPSLARHSAQCNHRLSLESLTTPYSISVSSISCGHNGCGSWSQPTGQNEGSQLSRRGSGNTALKVYQNHRLSCKRLCTRRRCAGVCMCAWSRSLNSLVWLYLAKPFCSAILLQKPWGRGTEKKKKSPGKEVRSPGDVGWDPVSQLLQSKGWYMGSWLSPFPSTICNFNPDLSQNCNQ